MKPEKLREIIKPLSEFTEISSKNPYMISYVREDTDKRYNIYFTNMTITVQSASRKSMNVFKNVSPNEIVDILIDY